MSTQAIGANRLVTADPARTTDDNSLGVIEDAVIIYDKKSIHWVGPRESAPLGSVPIVDFADRVITPGLIDAHTHAAWVGTRHNEYAMRMAGADYRAIAAAGGGILSSYRETQLATEDEVAETLILRLKRMANLGVTSCEVKSGYGLDPRGEEKQLRAIARAANRKDVPRVVATFLALHALPESAKRNRASYVEHVATSLVPGFARERLAAFVDAYVDENAFSVDEARRVGEAARAAGLGVRLHAGQFADVGAAELAAELGAHSADHVEHIGDAGVAALARAGVSAVMLPIASFTLAQPPPPVQTLRAAGVPLVVASDANPGTAPSESLPLAMALAVRNYGMTPAEVILGATRAAARALGLDAPSLCAGALFPGARPDFVVWDLPHEFAVLQPWGVAKTCLVVRDGRRIGGAEPA